MGSDSHATRGDEQQPPPKVWDLIIVGAGPAGMACAIYAGRARLETLILEGTLPGGQVVLNEVIENYPGFPDGISGFELGQRMAEQAARFGAQTEVARVERIDVSARPFVLQFAEGEHRARAVLISTGSAPRRLGIPGEQEYFTKGVSYCAVCDGPLYGGKRLMVVGGGNTAVEEAMFLSSIASEVTLVHRRDQLRADAILQERLAANDRVKVLWNHVLAEILGDEGLTSVRARHVRTQQETLLPVDGLFISIGNQPRSEFLPPEVARDESGLVIADKHLQTTVPGLFVAGDVRQDAYRQITFAVGDGTLAFRSIMRYLEENP